MASYFRELQPYTLEEIARKLSISTEKDKRLLKSKLNSCKYISKENNKDIYSIKYVGILILNKFVLRCYPKYIHNEDINYISEKFKTIIKVIKKMYNSPSKIQWGYDSEEGEYNFLSTAISLLEYYYSYGLYSADYEYFEENGSGDVSWSETLDEEDPLFINGAPIYPNVITLETESDYHSVVGAIQKIILTECSAKLEEYDLLELFNYPKEELSEYSIKDFGSFEYIVELLELELTSQFSDSKIRLIRLLIEYIKNEYLNEDSSVIGLLDHSYYGVNEYWAVWQNVCKEVFPDLLPMTVNRRKIRDGIKLSSILLSKRTSIDYAVYMGNDILGIIEKPEWHTTNGAIYDSDTFIPDLICVYMPDITKDSTDLKNYCFSILDAKYYDFEINEEDGKVCIDGKLPGLEDIVKQLMYQRVFDDFINCQGYGEKRNVFLTPFDGVTYLFGCVKFDVLQNMFSGKLNNIEVVKLDADKMYRFYLNGDKIHDVNTFCNLI